MTDHYQYSDSEVLRNKLKIKDDSMLKAVEDALYTAFSKKALEEALASKDINLDTYCDIHKTLFSELYEWAGKPRTCHLTKGQTPFCYPQYIEKEAGKAFNNLQKEDYYKSSKDKKEYATKLATLYGDINLLHPFREGNGRSQKLLFQAITAKAGYCIRWEKVSKKEHIDAVIAESNFGDSTKLIEVFEKSLEALPTKLQKQNKAALEKLKASKNKKKAPVKKGVKI